jgi:hypothetical protein
MSRFVLYYSGAGAPPTKVVTQLLESTELTVIDSDLARYLLVEAERGALLRLTRRLTNWRFAAETAWRVARSRERG